MESNKKEKSNLLNINFLAKHMSTPLAMGGGKGSGLYMNNMAPKMENDTPLEGNAFGKAMADNDGDYEKAKASMAPQMNKSAVYKQGYNAKLDESLGTKNGKKSQSLKDRRDESKGMEKSKGKGAYSSDSKMS